MPELDEILDPAWKHTRNVAGRRFCARCDLILADAEIGFCGICHKEMAGVSVYDHEIDNLSWLLDAVNILQVMFGADITTFRHSAGPVLRGDRLLRGRHYAGRCVLCLQVNTHKADCPRSRPR